MYTSSEEIAQELARKWSRKGNLKSDAADQIMSTGE